MLKALKFSLKMATVLRVSLLVTIVIIKVTFYFLLWFMMLTFCKSFLICFWMGQDKWVSF